MNTWVEAPPKRKGLGCFARGCLILVVFAIVLAIACFAGVYWGLHRYSALFYGGYWLAKTRSIAEAPVSVPEFSASDQQIQTALERWQDFEQKIRAAQPVEIELTADDINSLIAKNREARGKVLVSIEGNQLRLQTSVPLGELLGRPGYYFKAMKSIYGGGLLSRAKGKLFINCATITPSVHVWAEQKCESKGAQSLDNPQLDRIVVNGEQVPRDLLNWKYRSRRLRDYLADFQATHNIGTIEVRDGKVILRSRTE